MAKIRLTAGRIAEFTCAEGKAQDFMWCEEAPGLGVRVTPTRAGKKAPTKTFIFQSKLKRDVIRISIGDVGTYTIKEAQRIANRLRSQIDLGQDPRKVRQDELAQEDAARNAREQVEAEARTAAKALAIRESVTVRAAWDAYVADRSAEWSDHHIAAHRKIIQAGGEPRARSPKLTQPGPLAAMAPLALASLTVGTFEAWAKEEAAVRPSSARLAQRLLKAFLNWCVDHPVYGKLVAENVARSKKATRALGKAKVKNDVLQREQLSAWFTNVQRIGNPVIAAYLQCLLLIGCRREELAQLRWEDVDFQWSSIKLKDKVEGTRTVPLTPFVAQLMHGLPRRNQWVFSSPAAASGRLAEPRIAHNQAVKAANLPPLTLHGLRRSFASLSEWTETPAGIAAQIQGHAPQGVREQNYIRRPLDLLRMWHTKIEGWMLEQAGVRVPAAAPLEDVRAAA